MHQQMRQSYNMNSCLNTNNKLGSMCTSQDSSAVVGSTTGRYRIINETKFNNFMPQVKLIKKNSRI